MDMVCAKRSKEKGGLGDELAAEEEGYRRFGRFWARFDALKHAIVFEALQDVDAAKKNEVRRCFSHFWLILLILQVFPQFSSFRFVFLRAVAPVRIVSPQRLNTHHNRSKKRPKEIISLPLCLKFAILFGF